MIFCSKDEKGIPKWKKILRMKPGETMVTRRLKPYTVGKDYAVQPGRGKKAVCRILVKSCEKHDEWFRKLCDENVSHMAKKLKRKKKPLPDLPTFLSELFVDLWHLMDDEAKKEGFGNWLTMIVFAAKHKLDFKKAYRIEFELAK